MKTNEPDTERGELTEKEKSSRNFRPNKEYTTIAIYAFLVVAAAILFYEGIRNFNILFGAVGTALNFVRPVLYGFVFAYLLSPLLKLFEGRLLPFLSKGRMRPRTRRVVGMLLTYPSMFLVIAGFISIVLPQLVVSIERLFTNVPGYIRILEDFYANIQDFKIISENADSEALVSNLLNMLFATFESALENVYEYLTGLVPQLLSASARFTSGLLNLLLGIIISIYFLMDREILFAQLRKITSAFMPQNTVKLIAGIATDANRIFSGFIIGKIIDSLIIGIICFVGMSLLRMPYAVLISVIVGLTNVIPYFGPFIGAIPSVLIIFIESPVKALWFAIFILLLQQFDGNILGPKILGENTGLSALWVIFAIMFFSGVFGVMGMFIGVPLFALIYTLAKRFISYLLRRRNMPTETREYASEENPLIK